MLKKDIGEILSVRNITKKDAAWYCLVSIILQQSFGAGLHSPELNFCGNGTSV